MTDREDIDWLISMVLLLGSRVNELEKERAPEVALESLPDDTLIVDLELSMRASNILRNNEIRTLGELRQLTDKEIWRLPHCGTKTFAELRAYGRKTSTLWEIMSTFDKIRIDHAPN